MISLMDDPDMGVTLSVTSLIMALAQDRPEEYKGSYAKAAQRLKKIIVDNDIAPDYLYYKVPCPWIQVKFLRLLQYFPPSGMDSEKLSAQIIANLRRGHFHSGAYPGISATDSARSYVDAKECAAEQRAECRLV